jgi:hypothetical protein
MRLYQVVLRAICHEFGLTLFGPDMIFRILCFFFRSASEKRNMDKMVSTMLPQAKRRLNAALRNSKYILCW